MRVGVIGLGYWGSKVFEEYVALREDGNIDAVVACDTDSKKLSSVNDPDLRFESAERMFDEVDAAHICTNNASHVSLASEAIRRDIDVLVEKPLTTDRKSAYDLVELASERGRILQTGHIFRFADIVRDIRKKYQEGFFGDIHHLTVRWTHAIDPRPGTNVLWDLLPHPIDILNFVTGEWPQDPRGLTDAPRTESRAESAHIQCRVGDTSANVQVSWLDPIRRRTFEIAGSQRAITTDCTEQTMRIHENGSTEDIEMDNNTILAEARNFTNAIQTGNNTFNSAIVGARTVDTIQSIESELE